MTRKEIEKLPLRSQPVLDQWNSVVSKLDEKPAFVFIAVYCQATGEADLISVPCVNDTSTLKGMLFAYDDGKTVWVNNMKRKLKINDPVRKLLIHPGRRLGNPTPPKNLILAAFSTPERAIQCLSRWVETKGEKDLDQ